MESKEQRWIYYDDTINHGEERRRRHSSIGRIHLAHVMFRPVLSPSHHDHLFTNTTNNTQINNLTPLPPFCDVAYTSSQTSISGSQKPKHMPTRWAWLSCRGKDGEFSAMAEQVVDGRTIINTRSNDARHIPFQFVCFKADDLPPSFLYPRLHRKANALAHHTSLRSCLPRTASLIIFSSSS
jgi:hypothetical protein